MNRVTCRCAQSATTLATILEHEGYPTVWIKLERVTVITMAPTIAITQALDIARTVGVVYR